MTVYDFIRELTESFDPNDNIVFKIGTLETDTCDYKRENYCSLPTEAQIIIGGM